MASPVPQIRPLRRSEYDQLVALGTFRGERVELVGGELRRMSPIGPPHASAVDRLLRALVLALGKRAWVRCQASFSAGEYSQPEPDLSVLPLGDYSSVHPQVAHLIVEVADSSLRYDRGEKAALYAESGVPEYWIVNLVERVVEVHRSPRGDHYEERSVLQRGSRVSLLAFPDVEVAIDDIIQGELPPRS